MGSSFSKIPFGFKAKRKASAQTSFSLPLAEKQKRQSPPTPSQASSASSSTPTPERTPYELQDHAIDDLPRPPLRVIVIGAGLSGILAGILLPKKVPHLSLTILEKNPSVGGTWYENIYPGVRCDVPAHVYQSTFDSNRNWSEQYAQGHEILEYWQSMAKRHKVEQYIKLGQKTTRAEWDAERKEWRLQVEAVDSGERQEMTADVLISAIGRFNAWKLPKYEGMDEYRGVICHSSNWDPTFDVTGKKVAVIGNGASGIQVVPQLQKIASRLDHYCRSPTWIAKSLSGEDRTLAPFSAEEIASFQDDDTYLKFRKSVETKFFSQFSSIMKGSKSNTGMRQEIIEATKRRIRDKPEIAETEGFFPPFSPGCRRLTPGPGYLEALTKDNVDYIRAPIKRFTATGIETVDGKHREVDAVICSTGANISFAPPFPIVSGDSDLSQDWQPTGKVGFPKAYLGVSVPGFPNFFMMCGPAGSAHSGTATHTAENTATYIARVLRKIVAEGLVSIMPSEAATGDFVEYQDAFWRTTVMSEDCSSWYNGGIPGGKVHGLWPGSSLHAVRTKREPRWEDFEYVRGSKNGNRFGYLGNGWTKRDEIANGLVEGKTVEDVNMVPYLTIGKPIDLRTYHEDWAEVW